MDLAIFTFNPFQENTYILYDETMECIIIDPGCSNNSERKILTDFINSHKLNPVRLLNTHCHIDHILGNKFISEEYNLELEIPLGEEVVLESGEFVSKSYGIPYETSPKASRLIKDNEEIDFGTTKLKCISTPGHSPASISFFDESSRILIAGDVLFYESIGRTDLPGGNMETLLTSISTRVFVLGDDVQVYPGHGPKTTIGHERVHNPFLNSL